MASTTTKLVNKLSVVLNLLPNKIRYKVFISFRSIEGKLGFVLRGAVLKSMALKCGDDVLIFPYVFLSNINKISFGSNISIHPMSYIDGIGGLRIGDDVSIAHGVTIMTTEHKFAEKDKPIREQGYIYDQVTIGSNVWIGAKATILAGTKVSNGMVVGANSVVTKSYEADSIIAGCPAKLIKKRF